MYEVYSLKLIKTKQLISCEMFKQEQINKFEDYSLFCILAHICMKNHKAVELLLEIMIYYFLMIFFVKPPTCPLS